MASGKIVARPRRAFLCALVLSVLALPACAAPPLRILLTNDDGYASPGLGALHDALRDAGHDVVVVAPHGNRSGSSSSISAHGSMELVEQKPGVWSVTGTPADAVHAGLDVVLGGVAPDLVISGANFGENIGPATLVSGTVGAALSALQRGVPALAFSVGIDPKEMQAEPRFKSTLAAFPGCGDFAVRLVQQLTDTRKPGDALLPARTALNVNMPPLTSDALAGVVHTRIGQAGAFRFGWKRGEGTQLVADFRAGEQNEPVEDADTTWFSQGYVTITTLDRDVLAPQALRRAMEQRIAPLLSGPGAR